MMKSGSYTSAQTRTETRICFILNHFRSALTRLMGYTEEQTQPILDAIKNEEIETLEFLGTKENGDKRDVFYRLKLSLDFDKHHQLRSSQPRIEYSSTFVDDCSPEIYGLIYQIQQYIQGYHLTPELLYVYTEAIRNDNQRLLSVRNKLGTSPSTIQYDNSRLTQTESCVSPEAPELSAECHL